MISAGLAICCARISSCPKVPLTTFLRHSGAVLDDGGGHIFSHAVSDKLLADRRRLVQTHVEHQGLLLHRQVRPVQLAAGFQVASDQADALAKSRCVNGIPE